MGIAEFGWKHIYKAIYKIWARMEVIWAGLELNFVAEIEVKNSFAAYVSYTQVRRYTVTTHGIRRRYMKNTQLIFFCSSSTSNFKFKLPQIFTRSSQNRDSNSIKCTKSILPTPTQNKFQFWKSKLSNSFTY